MIGHKLKKMFGWWNAETAIEVLVGKERTNVVERWLEASGRIWLGKKKKQGIQLQVKADGKRRNCRTSLHLAIIARVYSKRCFLAARDCEELARFGANDNVCCLFPGNSTGTHVPTVNLNPPVNIPAAISKLDNY